MRSSDDPPISLFAFQDIITTVSGIMILVVLMLILDLISNQAKLLAKMPPSYIAADLVKAQRTKDKYLQIIAEEKRRIVENDKILTDLRQQDLSSLLKKIRDEEFFRKELIVTSANNDNKLNNLRIPLNELNEILTTLPEKDKSINKSNREMLSEAKRKLADSDAKLAEAKIKYATNKNKIAFTSAGGITKKLLLVECSGKNIRAQIQGESKIFDFISEKPTMDESINKFLRFLDGISSSDYFLVMLYKPSSSGYIMTLQHSVDRKRYDISKEPIEETAQGVYSE